MKDKPIPPPFDLERVKAELRSPQFKEEMKRAMDKARSMRDTAIIDQKLLNIPASF